MQLWLNMIVWLIFLYSVNETFQILNVDVHKCIYK